MFKIMPAPIIISGINIGMGLAYLSACAYGMSMALPPYTTQIRPLFLSFLIKLSIIL